MLITSLADTNGQCPPPREVNNETMASVNSRFAKVTENDILRRIQDITIPNDTKKATKLEMKGFRDKQCFKHDLLIYSMFCPDCQAPLMRPSP